MSKINKTFEIIKPEFNKIVFILVLIVLSSLLELIGISLIYPYIMIIQNPEWYKSVEFLVFTFSALNINTHQDIFIWTSIFLIILFIFKAVFYYFVQYSLNFTNLNLSKSLKVKMITSLFAAPYSFHLKTNSTLLLSTLTNDIGNFCSSKIQNILIVINEIFFLSVLFITIIFVSPLLILVAILFGIVLLIFHNFTKNKTFKYGKEGTESNAEFLRYTTQSILSFIIVKIFNKESFFISKVVRAIDKNLLSSSNFFSFLLIPRIGFETFFLVSFIILVLLFSLTGNNITNLISLAGTLGIASMKLIPSLSKLSNAFSGIKNGEASTEKVYQGLNLLKNAGNIELPETSEQLIFNNKIKLTNIEYSYSEVKQFALKGISLEIIKNQNIGIIGQSGSGKTTLINIFMGLLFQSRGEIYVDSINVKNNLRGFQNLIGYVPQNIYLLDDTIRRNIAFGLDDHEIDDVAMCNAIRAANLHEVIAELPEGVNTFIGENGTRLSGGQRQRIGIARALYRNPQILIFDEATSALDTENEKIISDAIASLAGEKTLIIIAHRLSTLKKCDVIYKMDKGEIVDFGTYTDIILKATE